MAGGAKTAGRQRRGGGIGIGIAVGRHDQKHDEKDAERKTVQRAAAAAKNNEAGEIGRKGRGQLLLAIHEQKHSFAHSKSWSLSRKLGMPDAKLQFKRTWACRLLAV